MNTKPHTKPQQRERRRARIRARVAGTTERPRLSVFRSNRFVSAQLIDDTKGATLAAAHGREFMESDKLSQGAQAAAVGAAIAAKAVKLGVKAVVFDRGGYRYGGQVKILADAAREAGLTF